MQTDGFDYRVWLAEEFSRRRGANPAYSLRSFARTLRVSPASISQVLAGKRHLSASSAEKVAESCSLAPELRRRFLTSAALCGTRLETDPPGEQEPFKALELATFQVIAHWHHYAILSLASTTSNLSAPSRVAKRLGITNAEARSAIERLVRLNLLEIKNGRMTQTGKPLSVSSPARNGAIRSFHGQMIGRARDSLENDPVETRDIGAITLAFDRRNMAKAGEMLKAFRREFASVMESGRKDAVYQLCMQFFPLTKEDR